MKGHDRRTVRAWIGTGAVLFLSAVTTGRPAGAQSVGFGSSPGRAAYRPQAVWNDGPFYTVNHWNPYSPRSAINNDMIESDPVLPPWTNGPHGRFNTYTPARGALYPYAEGFSPYSGYAAWYKQTYGFEPTRADVVQARGMFFRSAPRPPDSVLPPLPPPTRAEVITPGKAQGKAAAARPRVPAGKVVTGREPQPARVSGVTIYRSSVAGW